MPKAVHLMSCLFSGLAFEDRQEVSSPSALRLFVYRPMPSLVRLMLSREHPTRLSFEPVVVRRLHLVFGTSKPSPKEQALREQGVFSYQRSYFGFQLIVRRN